MEIINACGNAYTIAIMNETFQRRANLGKMLILSTGYYGGNGILLDVLRRYAAMMATCSTACTIWNPIIWGRRKTTSEPLFPV